MSLASGWQTCPPTGTTPTSRWIHPLPHHIRAVLPVLHALWVNPLCGRTIRAGAVSGVRLWSDGKKVSCEPDDLQRLGITLLDLRCADGSDQHELGKYGAKQRELCRGIQRRNGIVAP